MTNLEQQALDVWNLSRTARNAKDHKERIAAIGKLQHFESSNTHIQKIAGFTLPPDPPDGGRVA